MQKEALQNGFCETLLLQIRLEDRTQAALTFIAKSRNLLWLLGRVP